jgi:enoyl-CoA hydratase/carnithine racemase
LELETLVVEKSKKTAYVMLNRPDSLNGINHEMIDDLAAVIEDIKSDSYVKAVVITGAGRAFSVGADIDVLTRGFNDYPSLENFLRRFNRVLNDLEALDVPVIAAVNGLARAGGFELMLACDFVIASSDARIGDNHTQFGVMPGGGATQRAPRKLGVQKAKELIFSAKWLQGQEVADYGIALKVVPDGELSSAVEELADQFRDKSRDCLAAVKRAIQRGDQLPIEDAINLEIEVFMDYVQQSPDAREGFTAYLEKRTPAWAS